MQTTALPFGTTRSGHTATKIQLENRRGMRVGLSNYGAALVSLLVPDRDGNLQDVVLGFDDVSGYEATDTYMGATIGRHAGQICRGHFSLDGRSYTTVINDHDHTMHGGPDGFHHQLFLWEAGNGTAIFRYRSPHGEAGFPGNLDVEVIYQLTEDNTLRMEYTARCDRDTVLNMTNHAYFNLSGTRDILSHRLQIFADDYTPVDDQGLPTGEIQPVAGTAYDFTAARPIGERITWSDEQLKWCCGYDHNWVLRPPAQDGLRPACQLSDPEGRRTLRLYTTQPGLQMYSGNYLNGTETGKNGQVHFFRGALCLEPQRFPNGLACPNFPSPILHAGETYHMLSVYEFR